MKGSDRHFIIPVYQRNYDWRLENCKQLYNDLVKIIKKDLSSHFFGSLVSYNSGSDDEYLIIDGQQHLTTVTLLFLAMYNLINRGVLSYKRPKLEERIQKEFLLDEYNSWKTKIKLNKNDQLAFVKLFSDPSEHIRSSNVTVNYEYFYDRLQQEEISIDDLYEAICRLEFIHIRLERDDNPQLIFESLNSTGLDLSEGDKIRNFVLMGLTKEKQENYYENFWNKIEMNTNYDVSSFEIT